MSDLAQVLAHLEAVRAETKELLANLPDAALDRKHPESGRTVRFYLQRLSEHQRQHVVQIRKIRRHLAAQPTEAQDILALADTAHGEMLASLVGLGDEQASATPYPGGWSAVQVIGHVAKAEERYREALAAALANQG